MLKIFKSLALFLVFSPFIAIHSAPTLTHELRDAWIASPIDESTAVYVIGGKEHPWEEGSILFFESKTNLDGLAAEHLWRFQQQIDQNNCYLSNYYPTDIVVDGRPYKSSEHYYQAIKFPVDSPIYQAIVNASTPDIAKGIARKYGKEAILGDDQEMSRRMKKALWAKFVTAEGQPNELGIRLINTGDGLIIEGNRRVKGQENHSDRRWGMEFDFTNLPETTTLAGQNLLGKLLMELRSLLMQ